MRRHDRVAPLLFLNIRAVGAEQWGVAKGSSISRVAKFKGDEKNASCQILGREVMR